MVATEVVAETEQVPQETADVLTAESVPVETLATEEAAQDAEIPAAIVAVKAAMKAAEYEEPSELLKVFYRDEKPGVVATCEEARKAWKRSSVALVMAHDAFAGNGREGRFKLWCELAGVSYSGARSKVSRAKRGRSKGRGTVASGNTSGDDTAVLTFTFKDATDRDRVSAGLQKVIDDKHATTYEEAELYLVDAYAGWVTPDVAVPVEPEPEPVEPAEKAA